MKLKQIIGFVLLVFMSYSMWNKFKDGLQDVQDPMSMGALLVVVMLILLMLIIRITRY